MNIPDAKDARKSFENGENLKAQDQDRKVSEAINRAIQNGECSIGLSFSLMPSVQKKLEAKGYKYSNFYDQRESESIITISW